MSTKLTARVWALTDTELKDARLLTLLALADYANEFDLAWPSIPTLAQRTRICDRQVQRAIQWLVDHSYIEIDKKGNGRGNVTSYKVTLKGDITTPFNEEKGDIVAPIESIKDDMVTPFVDVKGDISSIKGDIGDENYSHARREPLKKPKTKRDKKIAADAAPPDSPDWQDFIKGLCNCSYKHTDIAALSAKDRGALLSEAKEIRDQGYTLDDIREWFSKHWVNDWRYGAKKNRPTPSQVRSGLPAIRAAPDEAYEIEAAVSNGSNAANNRQAVHNVFAKIRAQQGVNHG